MTNLLLYFSASITATLAGLLFYMAVENLHPPGDAQGRRRQILTIAILSVLLTPLGAWFVSVVFRLRKWPIAF